MEMFVFVKMFDFKEGCLCLDEIFDFMLESLVLSKNVYL